MDTYSYLTNEIKKEYIFTTENIKHAIYIIDDIMIDGEFYDGMRTIDHASLVDDRYNRQEWERLLKSGIVIVHETKSYISDTPYQELDNLGYQRLPLNSNHITGFKA